MIRQTTSKQSPDRWPLILHRADQFSIVILASLLMAMVAGHWLLGTFIRNDLIEIDKAAPLELEYRIRVNEADWPELTLLPGIGPTLARRIIADRACNGRYQSIEQLQRVKGIGPKTIRRIRAHVQVP